MKIIELKPDVDLRIELSLQEFGVIQAALNEVCNGIEVFEFETRIGASPEDVAALLKSFTNGLDDLRNGN